MPQIIDGKKIAQEIKDEMKIEADKLRAQGIIPCMAVIIVGDDPASAVYVGCKRKDCAYVGIESRAYELPKTTAEEELLTLIAQLNEDKNVHGILVQLPLPGHMDEKKVINAISPDKDVDGFHPVNVGRLCTGVEGFVPCTPAGIVQLLHRSGIKIEGKECVVIGRSNIVGKPASLLLLRENGTVTMTHSKTENLMDITKRADIVVAAAGRPKFITKEYLKKGAVVIDVGIHRNENNKLCGDVDFEDVFEKVSAITPVPGGVGVMTRAMLMYNCISAAKREELL